MRDIRGDLQDRASFLEEQIAVVQSEYEKAAERLAQEHQATIGDLQAELEAVTTLLEGEYRRLTNTPEDDERRQAPPQREAQPAHREAPQPQHLRRPPAAEAEPRERREERHEERHERRHEPAARRPEREPYRHPAATEAKPARRTAPAKAAQPAHSEPEFERRQAPAREADTYRRPAAEAAAPPRRQARAEEPEARLAAPQVYRRAPIAPERERREAPATQAHPQQPQQPPLADFLIRKLSDGGAMTLEDLCQLAVQEGYFADGESPDRGVQLTLMNVVKAGFIRQLPNGAFAPATVMDTIRLRRAI